MITTILLSIVLVVALSVFTKSAYKKPKNFPPGPPSLPVWGAYWIIIAIDKCLSKAFLKLGKFYNTNIVGLYMGPYEAIIINDYPTIREVLYRVDFDGRMDILLARVRSYYKKLGIFFTDGDNWMVQRRFALRYMRDFGFGRRCPNLESVIDNEIKETFESCITGPIYEYEKEIVKGDLVRLPDIFAVPSINGMMAVFMQETLPRLEYDKLWKLATAGLLFQRSSDDTGRSLNITPWLKDVLPNYSGYNDMERIKKYNDTFDENNDRNFIDMFIRKMKKEFETYGKSTFTLQQLVLTCVDFTFPPSSASTAVLAMLVERVLMNPDIQRKIYEEIDTVVGRDRNPTLDDRSNMPYTESCIREIMRLESVVPLSLPHRAMHDTKLGGYDIPENTMVMINLSAMHHDKALWGDPENFRPERFLDDSGKLCLSKDKSLPFGAGKRLCAGETYARQTLFSIFAGFMATFNVSTADGNPQTKLRKRIPGITITSQNYWVRVTPRNAVSQRQLGL